MLKFPLWRMIAVVLLANTAALYLVVGNSGAPDATLQLTERELRVTNLGTDTTGMTLTLQWDRNTVMPWFDRAKLASLGFDCSTSPDAADAPDDYSTPRVLPRSAYVVFDYDPGGIPVSGQADAPQPPQSSMGGRAVDKAPAEFAPRLRPIDAGTDPRLLRARYTDRHRYLITAGTVRPTVVRANANRPARVQGQVLWIDPSQVYVPQDMQGTIVAAVGKDVGQLPLPAPLRRLPRYEVTLEYGSRWLPRVVGIKILK